MTSTGSPWWKGAAIYQIYPRSFRDSNGDGTGDLRGIAQGLDHIASLGVDAVWISPFFTSPMKDFGYDVADYCGVDPVFGTLEDFDAVVARAQALGLKVIIDQVFAHTSDQHPWFAQSRANRINPRADWYVWANPKADGTPPCNWQSVFGGPAWTWDARRRQYYMHTFLKEQPQLNAANPEVQDALLAAMEFWLKRGVDGFRLDALNHAMHDPLLRDNPPAPDDGRVRTRPFDYQLKVHSQSQPGMLDFGERIRALCDRYGAIHTVAEIGGDNAKAEMAAYTAGETRLSSAYGFDFLYSAELSPQFVAEVMAGWVGQQAGWPTWAFENHDAPRAISRWCKDASQRDAYARMKIALLAALRGNIILYQGEELGLEQDDIPFELLRDPEAIANWPLTLSRDGARTPLPWSDGPNGGFSSAAPWLPLSAGNLARHVAGQHGDPASLLAHTRRVLALRRESAALREGGFTLVRADGALLEFVRGLAGTGEGVRCRFNLSAEPAAVEGLGGETIILSSHPPERGMLPGYGFSWTGLARGDFQPQGAEIPPL